MFGEGVEILSAILESFDGVKESSFDDGGRKSFKEFPENILESENSTEIQIAIPGREKSDFSVRIINGVLQIRAKMNSDLIKSEGDFILSKQEIQMREYSRDFVVEGKVEDLKVVYYQGILAIAITHSNKNSFEATID